MSTDCNTTFGEKSARQSRGIHYSGGLRRIRSPGVGGRENGNCQTLSFIHTFRRKSSCSFHGPIHLFLVPKKTQPCASVELRLFLPECDPHVNLLELVAG